MNVSDCSIRALDSEIAFLTIHNTTPLQLLLSLYCKHLFLSKTQIYLISFFLTFGELLKCQGAITSLIIPWEFFDTEHVSLIIMIIIKSVQRFLSIVFIPMSKLARQMASQLAHFTFVPS